MDTAQEFEDHRSRLFSLAYRMLGSAAEAEDAVQDAYLRWHGVEPGQVAAPGPWLAKVVTNLCLNRLTSARVQREEYFGPWIRSRWGPVPGRWGRWRRRSSGTRCRSPC